MILRNSSNQRFPLGFFGRRIRSKAFSGYTHDDYFNFNLSVSYFKPLIIRDQFNKLGDSLLKTLGIPSNSWFVCVHIRESSYLKDSYREWKNQEISNYITKFI